MPEQLRREITARRTPYAAIVAALLFALPAGCSSPSEPATDAGASSDATIEDAGDATPNVERHEFPDDFLFGTAVAGLQVDMGCPTLPAETCEPRNSDWYQYVTSPETVEDPDTHLSGDPVSLQAGFWELYPEDIRRADERLQNNAFRFSIEWSRIFPEPTDDLEGVDELAEAADDDAVERYHDLLKELRDRGMTPLVTLNHYSLPTWLHDPVACHEDFDNCENRGWVDRERAVREISKYARFVAREFGGQVDRWATLNEPMAVLVPGYLRPSAERSNPPAVKFKSEAARTALTAMIEGHAAMYDAIHDADTVDAEGDGAKARVGLVLNVSPVEPLDPESEQDRQASENVDYLYNRIFLNALVDGEFDGELDGSTEEREDLEGRMDYIGINYYATLRVEGLSNSVLPDLSPLLTFDPTSFETVWDRPKGIYEVVTSVHEQYDRPVVIAENGTPVDTDSDDPDASPYLVRHLDWLNRAMVEGVPVRGYFYWSLLDTYEWNKGMDVRMGLFGFDPQDDDKARRPRPAADTYGAIARDGRISDKLRDEHLPD